MDRAIAKWNTRAPTTTTDAVTYPPGTTLTTGDTCPRYGADDGPDALEDC